MKKKYQPEEQDSPKGKGGDDSMGMEANDEDRSALTT